MLKDKKKMVFICFFAAILILVLAVLIYRVFFFNSYKELTFSKEAGFYDEEFQLEIYAPKGDVYYTLDGSIPDESDFLYVDPINIIDASENENVWSLREDVSAGFLVDEIAKTENAAPNYMVPDTLIDKCTIVRAVHYDEDGNRSLVKTASYFVGYGDKEGYDEMNVLSIVTEPDNLFDYENGIYVLGRAYDEYFNKEEEEWYDPYWWWWDANYNQKGEAWEREACLQFFNKERQMVLSKDGGIRVQGGGSRGRIPRSFNLYARKEYDGEGKFNNDFFETDYRAKRLTLFAGGDQYITKLNDYLMAEIVADRNFATMDFEPYVMFLDGEYWGVYFLTEKYDEEYLEYHYGVDEKNIIMVKNGKIEEGEENDLEVYKEMKKFFKENDMSIPENYEKACEIIDMDSFVDYYAAQIYIGRSNDWPKSNYALWRTREIAEDDYSDGKWRWMLFDVNSGAMNSSLIEADTIEYVMEKDVIFESLMQNDVFKKKFAITILELADTAYTRENIDAHIEEFKSLMQEPMSKQFERFWGVDKTEEFEYGLNDVKNFFANRREYVIQHVKTHCGDNIFDE